MSWHRRRAYLAITSVRLSVETSRMFRSKSFTIFVPRSKCLFLCTPRNTKTSKTLRAQHRLHWTRLRRPRLAQFARIVKIPSCWLRQKRRARKASRWAVETMLILDLCAGLKGASQAMKERGWQVITLDIDPRFKCDITADVREWHYPAEFPRPDLIWASPPCDEFARESMPWSKTGKTPDMSIVLACKRIIEEAQPKYYVVENVRGAINYFRPHFGNYRYHVGAFYLWGFFPVH